MARVAIVTGGTRGIGEAISVALRDQGMKVAANYAGNDERAREFSERTGIPIAWNRVHELPDFVFFDHSVHVAKGVACFECHGRVDQMPLTWRAQPLQMQWCLACHRNPAPHLHPHEDVFRMPPPAIGDADAQQLARLMHIESQRRMTACSTCHR